LLNQYKRKDNTDEKTEKQKEEAPQYGISEPLPCSELRRREKTGYPYLL